MLSNYPEQEILLPANSWLIFFSLIAALLLNFVPLEGILLLLRPDFVALTLLYWGIYQPHHIGLSIAFIMGLLMDVSNIGTLGQHALAYCVITYFALIFHRRLRIFNPFQQLPQIILFLFLMQSIILLTALLNDFNFPGWRFFLNCFTGMLAWPFICFSMKLFCKQKNDPNLL